MPWKRMFERDRNQDGRFRKVREDAKIGNIAPDLKERFGYRKDKTVGSLLKEEDVPSLTKLRRK